MEKKPLEVVIRRYFLYLYLQGRRISMQSLAMCLLHLFCAQEIRYWIVCLAVQFRSHEFPDS